MILAADVGGTKCNLGLFAPEGKSLRPLFQRRYSTKQYSHFSFLKVIHDFRSNLRQINPEAASGRLTGAAFASAGVMVEGRFQCVNVPWVLDGDALAEELGLAKVLLLNDLEATASSIVHLPEDSFLNLNKGSPALQAPKALIAAGTGLGEAILLWDGEGYRALASEGGQTDFAPRTEREIELLKFLLRRAHNVCAEDVLSGRGFRVLHEFLSAEVRHRSFDQPNDDPAQEITSLALAGSCPVCVQALDMWVETYGAEAGNLALKVLSFGGVYVAGGIALKILNKLKDGSFVRAFCDKANNFTSVLARIPVRVVLDENAPLLGAAYRALAGA